MAKQFPFIDKSSEVVKADIYPFADSAETAPYTKRITVLHNGAVRYDGRDVTPEWAMDYLGRLAVSFAAAFRIAGRDDA